jgi:hypothetical protein
MPHQQHTRMLRVARDLLAPVAAAATRISFELMLLCVRASMCLQQQQQQQQQEQQQEQQQQQQNWLAIMHSCVQCAATLTLLLQQALCSCYDIL